MTGCRVLEASAEENAVRVKRVKRSEGQPDMSSPADWVRQDDWPVGIRNVGNTCWFSAVIQVSRDVSPDLVLIILTHTQNWTLFRKCSF